MYELLSDDQHRAIGRAINGAALFSNVRHKGCFLLHRNGPVFEFKFGIDGLTYSDTTIEGAIEKAINGYLAAQRLSENHLDDTGDKDEFLKDKETSGEIADICNRNETPDT